MPKYVPKLLDSNKRISNKISMAYLLQLAAREPLRSNIVTSTNSGRRCHTIITQSLHSCCRDTNSRRLTI